MLRDFNEKQEHVENGLLKTRGMASVPFFNFIRFFTLV